MARQLAVFFFAAIVLLCETLLFQATKYVLDYIVAMAVISCAVAGIGLGAFLASRWSWSERNVFGWCCGGTAASLYLAAWVLLRYPNLFLLLPAIAGVFVCPSYFIARAFAQGSARGVYLFDMLGAGTAVLLTVWAYQGLTTEAIFLVTVTVLPLVGALATAAGGDVSSTLARRNLCRAIGLRRPRWHASLPASDAQQPEHCPAGESRSTEHSAAERAATS